MSVLGDKLSYSDIGEMTIGQIYDFVFAQNNILARQEEKKRELEEEKRLGKWASSEADFAMLRG